LKIQPLVNVILVKTIRDTISAGERFLGFKPICFHGRRTHLALHWPKASNVVILWSLA